MKMITETESEIESIDVSNEDIITALARVAAGDTETMVVAGDGPRRMAVPASDSNVVIDITFDAEELVTESGTIADEVTVEEEVELNIV